MGHITDVGLTHLIPERIEKLQESLSFDFCPLCNATLKPECHRMEAIEARQDVHDPPSKRSVCGVCRVIWQLIFQDSPTKPKLLLTGYNDCFHRTPTCSKPILLEERSSPWEWTAVFAR